MPPLASAAAVIHQTYESRRHLRLDPLHGAGANLERGAILRIPTSPFFSALRMAAWVAVLIVGRPSVLP